MNAFIPPVSIYLQFEWWELYEAVYILTKWPPCVHAYGVPFQLLDKIGNRGAIYGWGGPERFNPKKLGKEFGVVFSELKKAIKNGEIGEIRGAYHPGYAGGTLSFVPCWEVITWALLKGFIFPKELSEELGVFQIKMQKLKNCHQKVKNQIIGQFLLKFDKTLNVTSICNHELMVKFGSWKDSNDRERKAIRRAINELFESKGERGAPAKKLEKKKLRPYQPRPIPLVYEKGSNGAAHYCFPLLATAIDTAVDVKINLIGKDEFHEMTEPVFMNEIITDSVINLYVKDASVNSVRFITYLILEKIRTHYSHPKICTIPMDVRRKMTIGQLVEKNHEFIFERFTESEKNLIQSKLDFSH